MIPARIVADLFPSCPRPCGPRQRVNGNAGRYDAIAGLGEPRAASAVEARQDRRRVKELERELHRKDKALAETAALLVLRKKLNAVFREGEDE